EPVRLPLSIPVFVPARAGDDLVLPVTVQIDDRQALLGMAVLFTAGGDDLDIRPGTAARIVGERTPVKGPAAIVPEDQREPAVAGDVADPLVVKLRPAGARDHVPGPGASLRAGVLPPVQRVGAVVAAVDDVRVAVPGQIVRQAAALQV